MTDKQLHAFIEVIEEELTNRVQRGDFVSRPYEGKNIVKEALQDAKTLRRRFNQILKSQE